MEMRLRPLFVRQATAAVSLALAGATLAITAGLWESSSRALDHLLDVTGRYTWAVEPDHSRPSLPPPLPAQGPALEAVRAWPGVSRLALSTPATRSPLALSYPTQWVSPGYFEVRRHRVVEGRPFQGRREVVVGHAHRELLGREVELQGGSFRVVGVLEPLSGRGGPDTWADHAVYAPVWAPGADEPLYLYVETEPGSFAAVGRRLEEWLEQRGLEGYRLTRLADRYGLELREKMARLLGGALGFGLLAVLLTAGANLSAFYLARALERLRALGIRRAVGASQGRLAAEEVVQALPWALAGFLLGIPLAYTGGNWLQARMGVLAHPGPLALVVLACGLLLLVALSALLPALWAVRQPPAPVIRGQAANLPQRRLLLAGAGLVLGVAGLVLQAATARSAALEAERLIGRLNPRAGVYSSFLYARAGQWGDPRGIPQLRHADYRALLGSPLGPKLRRHAYVDGLLSRLSGPAGEAVAWVKAYEGALLELTRPVLLKGHWPRPGAREMALGEALGRRLFGEGDPLGRELSLLGGSWRVTGVFRAGALPVPGGLGSDQALLPREARGLPGRTRAEIIVEVAPGQDVGQVLAAGARFLSERHPDPGLAPVRPFTLEDLAPPVRGTLEGLSAVYRALAVALLFLGGAGLSAQMLVGVSLRVREVGVRRALGASKGVIFRQFLGEGLRLALVCGLVGAAAGTGLALLAARLQQVPFALDWGWVGLALAAVAGVAALAAAGPAAVAARVPPARAMREE